LEAVFVNSERGDVPADEDREPCPTPLEWQDVLQSFVQDAEHWYLDLGKERILGRTWGAGPTLYFLNGLAGTHELYALIVWLLRDEFRCVVFDYPDSSSVTVPLLAELLPRVVELHGDDRAVAVYARDFGTQVARWTAENHAGLIGSLICQTPMLGLSLTGTERRLASLARHLPFRARRIPGRVMIQQRTHRVWFPPYDRSRFDFYLHNSGQQSISGMAQRFLLSGESIPDWTAETVPEKMLIVRTEGESPAQSAAAERLAEKLSHAQTEWLHISGQLACLTHPHRVAKLVREFLRPDATGVS
jgi:pimeloyl-ACP methyl ester carboxylesterase